MVTLNVGKKNMRSTKKFTIKLILITILTTPTFFVPIVTGSSFNGNSVTFNPVFQKGMSYMASSREAYGTADSNESLSRLKETRTEWVAICVFWYQTNITTVDIRPDPERTPSNESVEIAIKRCHELGLRVMLKPMVELNEYNQKRKDILPSEEWFRHYADFINFFAEFANQNRVDLFCIGCEFTSMIGEEWSSAWEKIFFEVRARYLGAITYAESWSAFEGVGWWNLVDYVGINAYFPLSEKKDPTLEELKNEWIKIADYIERWQLEINKPVIFTEIGYQSVNGTNMQPWNSSLVDVGEVDLQEQADCYEAALNALSQRQWFYGFYWWYWQANPNAGGEFDRDYSPQNKPAEDILKKWYLQEWGIGAGFPWVVRVGLAIGVFWVALIIIRLVSGRARKEIEEKEKLEDALENRPYKDKSDVPSETT